MAKSFGRGNSYLNADSAFQAIFPNDGKIFWEKMSDCVDPKARHEPRELAIEGPQSKQGLRKRMALMAYCHYRFVTRLLALRITLLHEFQIATTLSSMPGRCNVFHDIGH